MLNLLKQLESSIRALVSRDGFSTWLRSQKPVKGDYVVLNSSFLDRKDLEASQSSYSLVLTIDVGPTPEPIPQVASDFAIKTDFKLLRRASKNLPTLTGIPEAIDTQLDRFGRLPFILVGTVYDDVVVSTPLNHVEFTDLVLDPKAKEAVTIDGARIIIQSTLNPEGIWAALASRVSGNPGDLAHPLRSPFLAAFRELEEGAYARLVLPEQGASSKGNVLGLVVGILGEHHNEYEQAFKRCGGIPERDRAAYNELLRISYNFAADAAELVRLVLSLCELKPLISWGTLGAQYRLVTGLKSVSQDAKGGKPSLKGYRQTVGDVRNSAFHHLFPFTKAIHVQLEEGDLAAPSLHLFSEFGKQSKNRLHYQDEELVELLTSFTRSRERRVAPSFWAQQTEVMEATMDLLSQTAETLIAVRSAQVRRGAPKTPSGEGKGRG